MAWGWGGRDPAYACAFRTLFHADLALFQSHPSFRLTVRTDRSDCQEQRNSHAIRWTLISLWVMRWIRVKEIRCLSCTSTCEDLEIHIQSSFHFDEKDLLFEFKCFLRRKEFEWSNGESIVMALFRRLGVSVELANWYCWFDKDKGRSQSNMPIIMTMHHRNSRILSLRTNKCIRKGFIVNVSL